MKVKATKLERGQSIGGRRIRYVHVTKAGSSGNIEVGAGVYTGWPAAVTMVEVKFEDGGVPAHYFGKRSVDVDDEAAAA